MSRLRTSLLGQYPAAFEAACCEMPTLPKLRADHVGPQAVSNFMASEAADEVRRTQIPMQSVPVQFYQFSADGAGLGTNVRDSLVLLL